MHLTLDLELYTPLRQRPEFLRLQGHACAQVLDTLDAAGIRVTLFVTGEFVTTYPALFERAAARHEIASHTMSHRPRARLDESEFQAEIADSRAFLRRLTGQEIRGFRAPLGQICRNLGALLHAHGYAYDSSVAATHIPGHFRGLFTPKRAYRPSLTNIRREDPRSPLWEFPVAVTPFVPIPCGGFFLSWVSAVARRFPRLRRDPHVMFLHPYDFVDLRGYRESYPWDRFKRTASNWRLLRHYCREMKDRDTTLESLLPAATGARAAE